MILPFALTRRCDTMSARHCHNGPKATIIQRRTMDPVEIPYTALPEDTLKRVIENFVLSEGTDYGHEEHSLEGKYQAVLKQLKRNEAKIVYDGDTESVFIAST